MGNNYEMTTKRKYLLAEVVSALQKTIRRGDARLATYFALEMIESGYYKYLWRRLFVISAEDCFGVITQEVESLFNAWTMMSDKPEAVLFGTKAAMLLAMATKCRDTDHAIILGYRGQAISDEQVQAELASTRGQLLPIPDAALDCHTKAGRLAGKTKKDFLMAEFDALNPKQIGLFDRDVENVRTGKAKM